MAARAKRRDARRGWQQWSESEARAALKEHATSGMSAEAFARSKGFSTQRLRYWKARLTRTDAVSFVSVRLPSVAKSPATTAPDRIEVVCDAVVLRVREDFDVEHLARIAVALSEARARRC